MYDYIYSSSMESDEKRDYVESIESDMLRNRHIEVMTASHEDALNLTSVLESRHDKNRVQVIHVHGRCLRIFSEPEGEHSLMMFVVIRSV